MKAWMWPWAGVYAIQIVIAMVVWNLVNVRGGGISAGIIAGLIFSAPMIALLRSRSLFQAGFENRETQPDHQ